MADANATPTLLAPVDERTLDQTLAHTLGSAPRDAANTIATRPTRRLERLAAPPLAIKRLGYDLGAELGRGGLGAVNLATQQAFDRAVAIKRLLVQDDRASAMKFYAEAVVTAALEHPNIVPVYDLLSDAQGHLQLVMKRVEGRTWKRLIHPEAGDEPRTLDDHLDILIKVVEAVSFAHDRGVLHRDLKPENVMVGRHGEVLVMDWGCAVAFGERESHPVVPRIEEIEHIAGTPSYMAPEMVLIEQRATGPHSDVFLLGAMLYEVLTGCRPHQGGSVMAVLRAAAMEDVVAPRLRTPEREVPGELEDVCMAALVREPTRRIATADAFLERLRAYRRHAQAVTLARLAERLLDEAGRLAGDARTQARADDGLRRAVAAAENACELWPQWPAGSALAARATITHARHCLSTGGTTQAESLAQRAVPHARAASDERVVGQAKAVAEQARRQGQAVRRRERTLRITRWATLALAALIVAGSLIATALIRGQQREAEASREQAVAALAELNREQAQRRADQRRYAPALVAQAKSAITSERIDDAADALAGAISFDPDLVEATMLQANVLAALGRYDQALPLANRWAAAAPTDAAAKELAGLCALAATQDRKLIATRCAELFMRQHLPTLAKSGLRSNAERLIAYRARIEQIAPGTGQHLQITDQGELFFDFNRGLMNLPTLVDLSPLRGMPFCGLDLSGTGVVDVSPLAEMPLRELKLDGTKVRDLSPLRRCPLITLQANNGGIDVSTLAGFRLQKLWAYGCPQIRRIDALRGMPLEGLHLAGAALEDLSPLAGAPLTFLRLSGPFTTLDPLRGMPLDHLEVHGAYSDLGPLAGSPLQHLSIASSVPLKLGGLALQLHELDLAGCQFSDPRELSALQPRHLGLSRYSPGGLDWLPSLGLSRLETVNVHHCDDVGTELARVTLPSLEIGMVPIDYAGLARAPVTRLIISETELGSWRTLGALRENPTLKEIAFGGKAMPVAAFWAQYDPGLVGLATPMPDDGIARPAEHPAATRPGLALEVCLGHWDSVKALAKAPAASTGVAAVPDASVLPRPEDAGLRFTGYIDVPQDGVYRFTLDSDDGSVLRIGDRVVVDNDGYHAAVAARGDIRLQAGKHALTLLYFQGGGPSRLSLSVTRAGQPPVPVPAAWFSHATP